MIGETDSTFIKPMVRVPYPDRGLTWPMLSPASDVTLTRGFASVDSYGDGLRAVSNKPSEVNVLQLPIRYFVQRQYPSAIRDLNLPKLLSRNIPGSLTGG